jgi:hypothetical protein
MQQIEMTLDEYQEEAERRFGNNKMNWAFICPVCKHIATVTDYKEAGAPEEAVGFSCIGRWTESKSAFNDPDCSPCDYTGGGLFRLNPVIITGAKSTYFELAPQDYNKEKSV